MGLTRPTYRAEARWDGSRYIVQISGLPRGRTSVVQGRTPEQAGERARDTVAVLTGADGDSFVLDFRLEREAP